MTDEHHGTDEETVTTPDQEHGDSEVDPVEKRTTAPQSPYTMRDVGIGAVVTVIGVVLGFLLPVLLV
jgi:hypothetical protein